VLSAGFFWISCIAAKLQTEVRRLQKDLEQRRQHRLELSEEILHEARSRLETLQNYVGTHATYTVTSAEILLLQQLGHNAIAEENEVTKVLESLVADNENLKHDNAELQNLLTEAREDVHALQEEVEENRAALLSGSRGEGNSDSYKSTGAQFQP
jgi:cysteinyl-tRNA synthetase